MSIAHRADPPVAGIPPEFTAARAMVAALFAGGCQALAQAAATGGWEDDGILLDPAVIPRAELDWQSWLGVARYEQTKDADPQAASGRKAPGASSKSS